MTYEEFTGELASSYDHIRAYGYRRYGIYFNEDILQEALLKAMERFPFYNETCSVTTYACGIMSIKQRQDYFSQILIDKSEIPDRICYQHHYFDHDYIISKIELMTEYQQQFVDLLLDGIKVAEIAKRFNKSPHYIKSYKCKIRSIMRSLINDETLLENHMPNEACARHKQHAHTAA